jgi:HD-like signal output (HDOD) protein
MTHWCASSMGEEPAATTPHPRKIGWDSAQECAGAAAELARRIGSDEKERIGRIG